MANEIRIKIAGYIINLRITFPFVTDYRTRRFLTTDKGTNQNFVCDVELGDLRIDQKDPVLAETADYIWYQTVNGRMFLQKGNYDGGWKTCFINQFPRGRLIVNKGAESECKKLSDILGATDIGSHLLNAGIMMLHASYITNNGKAILFTAPSGTGKTTQAILWRDTVGAQIINGDKALLLDREGVIYAAGLPYSGSSITCFNMEAPVEAIVLLEQDSYNHVSCVSQSEAVRFIFSQTALWRWDSDLVNRALNTIINIVHKTTIVRLGCLPNADAVQVLQRYLANM